jgi:hypothetical protein
MTLDLTPDERAVPRAELARITREPRFPFSPRTRTLPGILARLEPPKPALAPLRAVTTHGGAAAGTAMRGRATALALNLPTARSRP